VTQAIEELKFGKVSLLGKDIATESVRFNRLAHTGKCDELLLLQLVAETMVVKRFRAILCGGAKATAHFSDVNTSLSPDPDHWNTKRPERLYPTPEGYACYTQKLGYGLAQALFVTRKLGFMTVVTEESLWQELSSDRYTTPLLREWVPYIELRLRAEDLLLDAWAFNCRCGLLTANQVQLDQIVSEGLQQREILIPTTNPC